MVTCDIVYSCLWVIEVQLYTGIGNRAVTTYVTVNHLQQVKRSSVVWIKGTELLFEVWMGYQCGSQALPKLLFVVFQLQSQIFRRKFCNACSKKKKMNGEFIKIKRNKSFLGRRICSVFVLLVVSSLRGGAVKGGRSLQTVETRIVFTAS